MRSSRPGPAHVPRRGHGDRRERGWRRTYSTGDLLRISGSRGFGMWVVNGSLAHDPEVAKALVLLEPLRATIAIVRAGHVAYCKRMYRPDAVDNPADPARIAAMANDSHRWLWLDITTAVDGDRAFFRHDVLGLIDGIAESRRASSSGGSGHGESGSSIPADTRLSQLV